jgi:hypothetical protein
VEGEFSESSLKKIPQNGFKNMVSKTEGTMFLG